MNQPESIFDEQFDAAIPISRRTLLSFGLKINIWVLMMVSAIFTLYFFVIVIRLLISPPDESLSLPQWPIVASSILILAAAIVVFLMAFMVLMGWKWAIRFNWAVFAIWVAFAALTVVMAGKFALELMAPTAIAFLPYWIMLFRIQRKWER